MAHGTDVVRFATKLCLTRHGESFARFGWTNFRFCCFTLTEGVQQQAVSHRAARWRHVEMTA